MIAWAKLFYVFFKIGMFAFGGGYVILPMIYQDIQSFGLMSAHEFSNIVALSQMTPGPIAINAATYVGFKSAGLGGAIFATLGVTLPSFIIILTIFAFLNKFKSSAVVHAVLSGIRPATVGMIASAVIFFAKTSIVSEGFFSMKVFNNPLQFISIPAIIIFTITIICTTKFKMGPITLTILAGVLGAFFM
jgi:chromate transporter